MAIANLRELIKQEKEAVLQELRAESIERWAQIPERALIWQALVPAWTLPLACACNFPIDEWQDRRILAGAA